LEQSSQFKDYHNLPCFGIVNYHYLHL
jgi:hypothetical protein